VITPGHSIIPASSGNAALPNPCQPQCEQVNGSFFQFEYHLKVFRAGIITVGRTRSPVAIAANPFWPFHSGTFETNVIWRNTGETNAYVEWQAFDVRVARNLKKQPDDNDIVRNAYIDEMSHPYKTTATEPYVMYPQQKEGFHKVTVHTYLNDTDVSELKKGHAAVCVFSKIKWKRENPSQCRVLRDAKCLWDHDDGHYEWGLYIRDDQGDNTGNCGPDAGLTKPSMLPDPLFSPIVANPNAPIVSWEHIDTPRQLRGGSYQTACIRISVDRDFPSAKFVVSCARPCRGIWTHLNVPSGQNWLGSAGKIPDHSEVAAFAVDDPNPMPSSVTDDVCIESQDEFPLHIDGVSPANCCSTPSHP
jgi:hypothetical protein